MSNFTTLLSFRLVATCLLGGSAVLMSASGCSKKSSPVSTASTETQPTSDETSPTRAGVATIDVNQIATESGAMAEINMELDKREAEFNLILDGMRTIHLDAITKMEKEIGEKPSEEQVRELADLRKKQAAEYNVKWQDTRIKLSAIKTKLDEEFLIRLKPLAQKVASEKDLSIVVRIENVFCNVDQYDITEQVSSDFQKKYPKQEIAPVIRAAQIPSRGGGFVPRK